MKAKTFEGGKGRTEKEGQGPLHQLRVGILRATSSIGDGRHAENEEEIRRVESK